MLNTSSISNMVGQRERDRERKRQKENSGVNVTNLIRHVYSCNLMTRDTGVQAIPVQTWTGPKGFRRFRVPGFKTIGTQR